MDSLISGSIARKGGSINDGPRLDPSWFPDWFHADLPEKEREMNFAEEGGVVMTDNMFCYQIWFGRKQHKKARWKKARKRYALRYAKLCEKFSLQPIVWDEEAVDDA